MRAVSETTWAVRSVVLHERACQKEGSFGGLMIPVGCWIAQSSGRADEVWWWCRFFFSFSF